MNPQTIRPSIHTGRDMGFDGKTLIHPKTIEASNDVFGPTAEEREFSRRVISAHEEALSNSSGVTVVDGKLVENLHVMEAKRIIALAEAIECRE